MDIFDCVAVAIAYTAQPADPNWNPNVDLTNDQRVKIFNIIAVAARISEAHP